MSAYPSIDTEVLRTFVAIADQGGFTRAGGWSTAPSRR
jgi:hypothetical protein